jgi:hypothetical protein
MARIFSACASSQLVLSGSGSLNIFLRPSGEHTDTGMLRQIGRRVSVDGVRLNTDPGHRFGYNITLLGKIIFVKVPTIE